MADVVLTTEIKGFDGITGQFKKLTNALGDVEKRAEITRKATVAIGTAIAATTAAVVAGAKVFINSADNLSKMAVKTGVATDELSKLVYAADLSGVSVDGLQTGLIKLAKNVNDTSKGIGTAKEGFDELGISVKDATGKLKPNDEILKELANKFATMPDGIKKTGLAVDILGKAGADLIPFLNMGADGLAAMGKEAEAFGKVVSVDAGKAAEQLNDNISRLLGSFTGLISNAIQPMLPLIAAMSDRFVAWFASTGALDTGAKVLTTTLQVVVSTIIILKNAVDIVITSISTMGQAIYYVATGQFAKSFETIKTGMADIGSDMKDTSTGITEVWGETTGLMSTGATDAAASIQESNAAILEDSVATQQAIDEAVRLRGANEAYYQNQINDGWIAYYENLAKNDDATQAQLEQSNADRAAREVASAEEINAAWQLYYENLALNDQARKDNALTLNDAMVDGLTEGLDRLNQSSLERYTIMKDLFANSLSTMTKGFGNEVANWVMTGEKFDMEHVFRMMATQFLSTLVTMGANWAITQVLLSTGFITVSATGVTSFTALGTAGVASGTAVNIAWGPILLSILAVGVAVVVLQKIFEKFGIAGVAVAVALTAAFFPVALPFVAIGAAIVAIIAIFKNWDKVAAATGKVVGVAFAPIKAIFDGILWVIEKIVDAIGWIVGKAKGVADVVGKIGGGIVGGVTGAIGKAGDFIGDVGGKVASGAKSVGKSVGKAASKAKKFLGFATGGSFITAGPRLMMVGENGAERVDVSPAGTYTGRRGAGGNTIVNFNAPTLFDEITARRYIRLQERYAGGRTI